MCLTGFCHCQGYPPPPVLTRTSYWIRDWENVCKYIMIHIMFIKLIFIIHQVVLQAKEFHMYFFVDVDVDVAEMRRWGFVEPVQLCNTLVYSVDVGDGVLLTLILTVHVCNLYIANTLLSPDIFVTGCIYITFCLTQDYSSSCPRELISFLYFSKNSHLRPKISN